MATGLAGFYDYLQNILLFGTAAVQTALNDQGLQLFDDLSTLTEDDIAEVCPNARKPGRTVPNPAYVAPTAAAPAVPGVPAEIPNSGVCIEHVYKRGSKWYSSMPTTQQQLWQDRMCSISFVSNRKNMTMKYHCKTSYLQSTTFV